MEQPEAEQKNGTTAMAKLINQLNLPTLVAVALFGGGNFFVTKEDGRVTREEAQHLVAQVNDLHASLDQFERRQKAMLEGNAALLNNQTKMLDNQSRMLDQLHQKLTP